MLLQKSSVARRVYATIVHVKTNTDGYKDTGITFPNGQMQKKLIKEVYDEAGIDPTEVEYVEAHGTGTKVNKITIIYIKIEYSLFYDVKI